ncbi:MAG: VPDSG-CTERM sorting domain-containing protein [Opitutaceae bacterium]|nr:VPDSG-CTERM sorting domain-containing protein [Verrucomicrobiales bacterium]
MKKILNLMLSAAVLLCVVGKAHGHAISIGYENAGPGSVNIWLGTYEHGGHHLEGSLTLVGVLGNAFPSTTVAFSTLTATGVANKPAGLIDGVSNFYVQYGGGPNNLPLVGSQDNWLATFPNLPANHWQGVNFTGLAAGSYQFTWTPIANPTQEWSLWSSQMNGIFDLSGVVQPPATGVPDGGSSLAMFGLVVVGLAGFNRKLKLVAA